MRGEFCGERGCVQLRGWHSNTLVGTADSRGQRPGIDSSFVSPAVWSLHVLPCLRGFPLCAPVSSHTPKMGEVVELAMLNGGTNGNFEERGNVQDGVRYRVNFPLQCPHQTLPGRVQRGDRHRVNFPLQSLYPALPEQLLQPPSKCPHQTLPG